VNDQSILLPVNAMTTAHLIGVTQIIGQILQTGIMEFVGADFIFRQMRPGTREKWPTIMKAKQKSSDSFVSS
jgi:hypothetical protein